MFSKVMEDKEMYFYLDCFPYYFKGWTYGSYWNGWSCPRFTKETTIKILKKLDMGFYFINDTLIYASDRYEEEETLQPNEDGTYSLGAWSWVWSEISEEELKEQIWQSYKDDVIEF